ncbi:MAG: hypothetical protein KDA65_11275 [Planctomycetaceae bacterium]|nr:hypothetical protein [Planctomycetaceae bacterium]
MSYAFFLRYTLLAGILLLVLVNGGVIAFVEVESERGHFQVDPADDVRMLENGEEVPYAGPPLLIPWRNSGTLVYSYVIIINFVLSMILFIIYDLMKPVWKQTMKKESPIDRESFGKM